MTRKHTSHDDRDSVFRLNTTREGSTLRVSVHGRLDGHTGRHLEDTLGQLGMSGDSIVLDLHPVLYLDEGGIDAVIRSSSHAASKDASVTLKMARSRFDRVLTEHVLAAHGGLAIEHEAERLDTP